MWPWEQSVIGGIGYWRVLKEKNEKKEKKKKHFWGLRLPVIIKKMIYFGSAVCPNNITE